MPAVPKNRTRAAQHRVTPENPLVPEAQHLERLRQLRDRLTAELDGANGKPTPAAVAALGRELRSTLSEIGALDHTDTANHFRALDALRQRLSDEMSGKYGTPSSAATAALGRELRAVLGELASVDDPDAPPSQLDLIRAKYVARRAREAAEREAAEAARVAEAARADQL